MEKAEENFKKWLLIPGKNKTKKEESEDLQALLSRANKGKCGSVGEKTKAQVEQEAYAANQISAGEKRKATMQANKEKKALEQAAAVKEKVAAAAAAAAAKSSIVDGTSVKTTTGTLGAVNNVYGGPQVQQVLLLHNIEYLKKFKRIKFCLLLEQRSR